MTAAALAEELEVSKRTVYRDVADLIGQRVPISGEAGLGYLLAADYDMPPLMLTPDEIEAVVLGAQWVAGRSDRVLAAAARDVVAKITAVVPERLRPFLAEPSVGVKPTIAEAEVNVDPASLRSAIRHGRKLRLRYRSEAGEETERTVWPVILGYAETSRLLVAWCELREGFRHFRTDRIIEARCSMTLLACARASYAVAGSVGARRTPGLLSPRRADRADARPVPRSTDRARLSSPLGSATIGARLDASSLPNSTPHWSKESMFQTAPSVNTLCS